MANEPTIEIMNHEIFDFMEYVHSVHKEMDEWEMKTLKFHEDWNQLMRVVEKIRNLGYHIEITISVDISVDIIKLRGDPSKDVLHITSYSSALNAVYTAVYQFITWLNQQKQKDGKE